MHVDVAAWFQSEKKLGIARKVVSHFLALPGWDHNLSVTDLLRGQSKSAVSQIRNRIDNVFARASQIGDSVKIALKADADESGSLEAAGVSPVESDRSDVELAHDGDQDAFARLVADQQRRIAKTMWRFTRDRTEWECLVQDVFVEAYDSLAALNDADRFGSWLQTIAVRVGYRFWKQRDRHRNRRHQFVDLNNVQDLVVAEGSPTEAAECVHRVLQQLPPRDRLVLTLMYLEELSVSDIAERTDWSETMVKVQAHRARKKLKRLLQASHSDGGDSVPMVHENPEMHS